MTQKQNRLVLRPFGEMLIFNIQKRLDFGHTPLQRRQVTDNTRAFLLDKFYSFC